MSIGLSDFGNYASTEGAKLHGLVTRGKFGLDEGADRGNSRNRSAKENSGQGSNHVEGFLNWATDMARGADDMARGAEDRSGQGSNHVEGFLNWGKSKLVVRWVS